MAYQIHRLNFGAVTIDASMQVRGREPGRIVNVPAQGFLIVGGEAPVLVDAGFYDVSVLGSGGEIAPGQGFHEQLAAHGVAAGDLACVLTTHLHRDHAGHLDQVPMTIPVVVNRAELSCAFNGLQSLAYAKHDLAHLLDRMYTAGAMRFLDLDITGPVEVLPGIVCERSGGHTAGSMNVIVNTSEGTACLCGDLIYDVEGSLRTMPRQTHAARVQPWLFAADEPAVTNNFTTSVGQEIGALKRLMTHRFVLPAHDAPGVLDRGRVVGRVHGPTVPGPVTPV